MRTTRPARGFGALAILAVAAGACNDSFSPHTARPGVPNMTLAPLSATISAGHVVELTAQVIDESGRPLEGVTIGWSSSDEAVATVSASGAVWGRNEGRVIITARALGGVQTSSVRVIRGGSKPLPKPQMDPGRKGQPE